MDEERPKGEVECQLCELVVGYADTFLNSSATEVYVYTVQVMPPHFPNHVWLLYMNNHVHSAPQEHIERERKDSERRKNTQNIHNITTIHKPHGLEK